MMNEYPGNRPDPSTINNSAYEFRVNGRLTQNVISWFEEMSVTVDETTTPPQTIMQGVVRDQAAMYGLISRMRDLGLELLSVNLLQQKEENDGET